MEIRTFDPSYIESQVELGKNVTKNWKTFTQTSSEQLKRSYTNENFDPETRLYAFKDNQLVGFLTSSVNKQTGTAGFRFPLVAEGHEDCASPLIVKALDVLKAKGAAKIVTSLDDQWGDWPELSRKFNFTEVSVNSEVGLLDVDAVSLETSEFDGKVLEFNPDRDEEQMIHIFVNKFNMTDEQAKNNFEAIKNFNPEQLITHSVIYEEEKIVARVIAYQSVIGVDPANLGNIITPETNTELYFNALITKVIEKAKEKGIKQFMKFLAPPEFKNKTMYESMGVNFISKIKTIEKTL